jgi:Tfp pilus assembly protein PilO
MGRFDGILLKTKTLFIILFFLRLLKNRYEIEMTRNKETVNRLQSDLDRLKSQEDLQKQMSRGELDSLKEQRVKLERDKRILRKKIYSLENEKNGLEERYYSKYI